MGNKATKPKDAIPFDIRDEKNKFKLPNVLHLTAAIIMSQQCTRRRAPGATASLLPTRFVASRKIL